MDTVCTMIIFGKILCFNDVIICFHMITVLFLSFEFGIIDMIYEKSIEEAAYMTMKKSLLLP